MDIEDILPSRDIAFELLKKKKVPYHVRKHSIKVAEKALEIVESIKSVKLNNDLVEIGSLLHDIGRSKTHGFNHALIGGKILKEMGYPSELARICETHILGGLDKVDAKSVGLPEKNYLPNTLEEKIICLADKMMAGTKEVTIEERFNKWFSKYGRTDILVKAKKRIDAIQKEIEDLQ
ncbi:MAG: HDIG domain-containing protein [Candidatus Lokiarchaeota archaeon]|nr:HDIG domain-containing protein [Candidatus Lokiarchaeota archaeon]